MPVRRRRRHEHTLRFKPDLWGRETESGTVLFDGVVNLDENGEAQIELSADMVLGNKVTLNFGDDEYVAYVGCEGSTAFARFWSDSGNSIYIYSDGSVSATDENGDPITGEVILKLQQEPVELTTLFDGAVALTLHTGDIQSMAGTANLTGGAVAEGDWAFVYEDGALTSVGNRGNIPIGWPDGTYTIQVEFNTDAGDEITYSTDNLTVSSVNLKVAVPAT